MSNPQEMFSMVEECTDSYRVQDRGENGIQVVIEIPSRFADIWLVKLSSLQTNEDELAEYDEPEKTE